MEFQAPQRMMPRGFVVAGGRSSRMGRDKSLLPYRSATLLEHAISTFREVTTDVRILCGPKRRYEDLGVPVLTDALCGVGPIAGLYEALLSASADASDQIVWLAVDVPLVPPALLLTLLSELDRHDAAMARTENGPEPLCAAFRTGTALRGVRHALLDGRLKLTDALRYLDVSMIEAPLAFFANINTPDEYKRL